MTNILLNIDDFYQESLLRLAMMNEVPFPTSCHELKCCTVALSLMTVPRGALTRQPSDSSNLRTPMTNVEIDIPPNTIKSYYSRRKVQCILWQDRQRNQWYPDWKTGREMGSVVHGVREEHKDGMQGQRPYKLSKGKVFNRTYCRIATFLYGWVYWQTL